MFNVDGSVRVNRGIYKVEGLYLTGEPGFNLSLNLKSQSIVAAMPAVIEAGQQEVKIEVQLRLCVEGEALTPSGKCEVCAPG